MDTAPPQTLHYKRSHFATQLPVAYLYSPSHAWIAQAADGRWRVGLTLRTGIANEMLADLVLALHEEDRLCVHDDAAESREPRNICSLGIKQAE